MSEGRHEGAGAAARAAAGVLTVLFVVGIIALAWTGFTQSDDQFYAAAGAGWAFHFPYLPDTHWGVRHMVVWPIALAFRLFGESDATLAASPLFYATLLLGLCFLLTRRIAGFGAALLAVALLAAVPQFAADASIVVEDPAEAFLLLCSLLVFHFAWQRNRNGAFMLSGVLAALAFLTRETSLVLLLLYGLLFLADYGGRRVAYIWMGVGFCVVVGADTALLWWASGDPLYRVHLALNGIHHDNPGLAAQFATQPGLNRFGNLAAPRWLQPLVILFLDQSYGLLFWFGIPAAVLLMTDRARSEGRLILRLLCGFALLWLLVLSYGFTFLWVIARYDFVLAVVVTIPLAIALSRMLRDRQRWLAVLVIAALLGSDVLLIAASNRDPLFGERALVALVRETPGGTVLTDPGTATGAAWLLRVHHLAGRVRVGMPKPGDLYYFDHPWRGIPGDWPIHAPPSSWIAVQRFAKPPSLVARLLREFGLARLLPGVLARKLLPPPQTAALYRVPPGGERSISVTGSRILAPLVPCCRRPAGR